MSKTAKHNHLKITLQGLNRPDVRAEILQYWASEEPGTSNLTNIYRYDVETLADGSLIYLLRPARLNKGCDFTIICTNFVHYKNGKLKPPSHGQLINEVDKAIKNSPGAKSKILLAMHKAWNCEDPSEVFTDLQTHIPTAEHLNAERFLKLARWLFIEQDVTYWTKSGREMLRSAIEARCGKFPVV